MMSCGKVFLGGHASSFLLILKFYEVTFETRQNLIYAYFRSNPFFKSEESLIPGFLNPGF